VRIRCPPKRAWTVESRSAPPVELLGGLS
jgi:hypothetical protein